MNSREIFRVALKIIGFIVLLQAFRNVIEAFMILKGYAIVRLSTTKYWATWALVKIVAGVYLMVWNTALVNLAFPMKAGATKDCPETTSLAGREDTPPGNDLLKDPKALFGLIVKTVGIIVVLYGLEYFVEALLFEMKSSGANEASNRWLGFAVVDIGAGLTMMRWTAPLIEFAFPAGTAKTQQQKEEMGVPTEKS